MNSTPIVVPKNEATRVARERRIDAESAPKPSAGIADFFLRENINFLLTNRIPRRLATRLIGRLSRIEHPIVTKLSLAIWKFFAPDLDLSDAKTTEFKSLHECFIRELKPGARPIDPDPNILTSPCDGIVGASGRVADDVVFQAKGFPYSIRDLLAEDDVIAKRRNGVYVTLRLKSTMYHRFHAPTIGRVKRVDYISGDTWNVNPIALKRIERLFCKNERAVIDIETPDPERSITLVAVAAILVASIRLHFLDEPLDMKYRGPNRIPCDTSFKKGDELGYFRHGSTIICFGGEGLELCPEIVEGSLVRVGAPLFRPREDQS